MDSVDYTNEVSQSAGLEIGPCQHGRKIAAGLARTVDKLTSIKSMVTMTPERMPTMERR